MRNTLRRRLTLLAGGASVLAATLWLGACNGVTVVSLDGPETPDATDATTDAAANDAPASLTDAADGDAPAAPPDAADGDAPADAADGDASPSDAGSDADADAA